MGQGIPAVRGEVIEGDVAGYHYYPGRERVLGWFAAEGLEIVEEGYKQEGGGWGYRHLRGLRSRRQRGGRLSDERLAFGIGGGGRYLVGSCYPTDDARETGVGGGRWAAVRSCGRGRRRGRCAGRSENVLDDESTGAAAQRRWTVGCVWSWVAPLGMCLVQPRRPSQTRPQSRPPRPSRPRPRARAEAAKPAAQTAPAASKKLGGKLRLHVPDRS